MLKPAPALVDCLTTTSRRAAQWTRRGNPLRISRTLTWLIASAISLAIMPVGVCLAQNDPFDFPAGLPGFDAPAQPPQNEADADDDGPADTPLTEQLKMRARLGESAAAESIASLARIGRWDDVEQLLSQLAGRQLTDPVLADMGRRIDPAVMMRIRLNQQLSDASRGLVDRISVATKSANESPERLRQAIKQLGSKSRDQQIAGLRTLSRGGRAAVAELIQAAVEKEPIAPRDELLRAAASYGLGATQALRQLALYGTDEVRAEAIDCLARLVGSAATTDLLTALHAGDSTDKERATAAELLVKLGVTQSSAPLPSLGVTIATLDQDLQRKRDEVRKLLLDHRVETLWSLTANRKGVTFQDAPAHLKPLRDASDAAARLRRVGVSSEAIVNRVLLSDIGYRVIVDADWGDPEQIESIQKDYPGLTTPSGVAAAIHESIDQQDHAAALGMLRVAAMFAGSPEATQILHASSAHQSPLVRAVDHPMPRVRYEAAAAIAAITDDGSTADAGYSPITGYAGSSRFRRTLHEMRMLGDQPKALLLETVPQTVVHLEGLLSDLGYDVEVVGSAKHLEKCVAAGGDLRLVLAKTNIIDVTAVEMVDRVRRSPLGQHLPIVIYGHASAGLDVDRWDSVDRSAPVLLDKAPTSLQRLGQIRDSIIGGQRLPELSSIDRQRFHQIATDALAQLAPLR